MSTPTQYNFVRTTYLTAPTDSPFDAHHTFSGASCTGAHLSQFGAHTLGAASAGAVEINQLPVGAQSMRYDIGRPGTAAGSIQMRFEFSLSSNMAQPFTAFEGTITWIASEFTQVCFSTLVQPGQNFCQYGTQLKPLSQFVYVLTPAVIEAWLSNTGLEWLGILFAPLYYTTLNAEVLCGQGPPPLPHIDISTLESSLITYQQILAAIAWPNVCQCVPGSPSPVPYPPPVATEPPGWPDSITIVVPPGGEDAALGQIQTLLTRILQNQGSQMELLTALQRFHVPFGWLRGVSHGGLTGQGEFAVSRLVGFEYELVSRPDTMRELFGNPPYIVDVGWIAVDDGSAMLQELRLTRDIAQWFPPQMQLATRISYSLHPDIIMRVTELLPEP